LRLRLFPPDHELGWTPFAWLVYLSLFLAYPALGRTSPAGWALTLLGLLAFLPLYFRGYWVKGRAMVPVVLGIAGLGALYTPFNPGAASFFIYASAFVGRIGPPARALRWLAVIVSALALETVLLRLPPQAWIPGVVFSLIVGGTNIHFVEMSRSTARLRQARREVEHLAKAAERERIARDLHDLLGHTLSLVVLKAELAAKLAERDPARAAQEIREVEAVSRQALAEVRQAVRGYRARDLATERALARVALEAAGVELDEAFEPVPLPPEAEDAFAFGLREAVTNVVRHAGASRCRVRLEVQGGRAVLTVADDGRGGDAPEGAGLRGMRERAGALGGQVDREGASGTRLRLTIPLAARASGSPESALPS
jgi:two-component system, NarL family, sensor histidine kinase DesK